MLKRETIKIKPVEDNRYSRSKCELNVQAEKVIHKYKNLEHCMVSTGDLKRIDDTCIYFSRNKLVDIVWCLDRLDVIGNLVNQDYYYTSSNKKAKKD